MIVPILITGGDRPSTGLFGGYESVPRSQLLTGFQVLVQQGRLRIAARCREAATLRREMLGLKLIGHSTSGEVHDDLAVAVAIALWKARTGVVIR